MSKKYTKSQLSQIVRRQSQELNKQLGEIADLQAREKKHTEFITKLEMEIYRRQNICEECITQNGSVINDLSKAVREWIQFNSPKLEKLITDVGVALKIGQAISSAQVELQRQVDSLATKVGYHDQRINTLRYKHDESVTGQLEALTPNVKTPIKKIPKVSNLVRKGKRRVKK